jgi:hypothetical protein
MNMEGKITEDVTNVSCDEMLTVSLPKGTVAKSRTGSRLTSTRIKEAEDPPAPPEGNEIIGKVYEIEPDGATFEPAITLTICYDPESLSENVSEEELYIAYWDGSEWSALESTVDMEAGAVSANTTHFTQFALIGKPPTAEEPAPVPPRATVVTKPANFVISGLSVTPGEVEPGEAVTISVVVANDGGSKGSYTVVLKIDSVEEATEKVSLGVNDSETVTFTITKDTEGSYKVNIAGETGQFTVVKEEPVIKGEPIVTPQEEEPGLPMVRWLIGGVIVGCVFIAGIIVYFITRRRRTAKRI